MSYESEKSIEGRRQYQKEYMRRYRKENSEKIKEIQSRFWERQFEKYQKIKNQDDG